MLNVNLDDEAEKYLVEILAQEKITSKALFCRSAWLIFAIGDREGESQS
ncbi:MAG: hypothetical protein KME54_28515 [Tolypothrix brevis GSE-NOS-MK-07-07A]|jgi:hypothetical protein|nr:hypothetical protein [Tolypothrix brevis GSE-NOS-MK-07-07A]